MNFIKNNLKKIFSIIIAVIVSLGFIPAEEKTEVENNKTKEVIETPELFIETVEYASVEKKKVDLTIDTAVKHEIQRVADIYEKKIDFPDYSIPLNEMQTDLLNPNQVYESPRDYSFAGLPGSILVEPVQFRFSTDEKIRAFVVVKENEGESGFMSSILSLKYSIVNEQHEFIAPMNVINKYEEESFMEVEISGSVGEGAPRGLMIAVHITLYDHEVLYQTAPITVYSSVGKVLYAKTTQYEDNEVIIPVVVDVDKKGFYQLSGSLIDEVSGRPVTYLTAREFIDEGRQTINLKAHGSVLKAKNIDGPFLFKGITLIKKSPKPGIKEEYGETTGKVLKIREINLDKLSGEMFVDPNAQASLAFLRSLSTSI